MPISTPLQTQIEAIQARINTVAPNATPEDLVMLAKAIEAIAGQATVIDVVAAGDAKVAAVSAEVDSVLLSIQNATQQALSEIEVVSQASAQNIAAIAMDTPALHSAALLF